MFPFCLFIMFIKKAGERRSLVFVLFTIVFRVLKHAYTHTHTHIHYTNPLPLELHTTSDLGMAQTQNGGEGEKELEFAFFGGSFRVHPELGQKGEGGWRLALNWMIWGNCGGGGD